MAADLGGPVRIDGGGWESILPAAVDVPDDALLAIMRNAQAFALWAEVPEDETMATVLALREAWAKTQGLPTAEGACDKLAANMDYAFEEIEADCAYRYPGVDVEMLWRERRWRRLENLIRRLPQASLYYEKLLNDPEMVKKLIGDEKKNKTPAPQGIPVSEYTTTVQKMSDLIMEIRALRATLPALLTGKMGDIQPEPGRITVIEQVRGETKQVQHESLVARVLPGPRSATAPTVDSP